VSSAVPHLDHLAIESKHSFSVISMPIFSAFEMFLVTGNFRGGILVLVLPLFAKMSRARREALILTWVNLDVSHLRNLLGCMSRR